MYVSGHVATAYLAAAGPALAKCRPLDVTYALWPVILGTLTPDIIDKPLRALDLVSHSRTLGHSLFFFLLLVAVWKWSDLREIAHSKVVGWWVAGLGIHLFTDITNDMLRGLEGRGFFFSTWFTWPVVDYEALQVELDGACQIHSTYTSLELAIFAMALMVGIASRNVGRGGR